jgi:hypothetical protein
MPNSYNLNQRVYFTVLFRDALTRAAVDPTTVIFYLTNPLGTVVANWTTPNVNITNTSVGNYRTSYILDYPGDWYYRWEGSGVYDAAAEGRVCCRTPHTPGLI